MDKLLEKKKRGCGFKSDLYFLHWTDYIRRCKKLHITNYTTGLSRKSYHYLVYMNRNNITFRKYDIKLIHIINLTINLVNDIRYYDVASRDFIQNNNTYIIWILRNRIGQIRVENRLLKMNILDIF